jgi:hypothetical protein
MRSSHIFQGSRLLIYPSASAFDLKLERLVMTIFDILWPVSTSSMVSVIEGIINMGSIRMMPSIGDFVKVICAAASMLY